MLYFLTVWIIISFFIGLKINITFMGRKIIGFKRFIMGLILGLPISLFVISLIVPFLIIIIIFLIMYFIIIFGKRSDL